MKIAFVTPWQEKDGISLYAKELVESLKKGIEIKVFGMVRNQEKSWETWVDEINKCDIMHLQHEYSWWGSYTSPWQNRLLNFLKNVQISKIVTYHSVDLVGFERPKWGWWGKWQHRRIFSTADQIIVHTQKAKEGLIKNGVEGERISVIPVGVSVKRAVKSIKVLKKFDLEGKKFVSIFGYINPDKGYEVTLAALKNISDLYFVIGGDIQDETNKQYKETLMRSISQEEKIRERVIITGYLVEEDMIALMDSCVAVLLPRTHVNASYELSLALSQGKAIITSDLAYFKEVNERRKCLSVCPVGDSISLARELKKIINDRKYREGLEQKASEYAKRYSWDFIAGKTLKIYKDLTDTST